MAEIRRLRAEDTPALKRLRTIVYNGRRDFSKEETELDDSPLPRRDLSYPPDWSWGVFEGGRLVSALTEIDYLMRFDGGNVPMSGIGGVGTLPEARKGGLVRALFQRFLSEAHERGVVFSCLAPFSHGYYRQFGYEIACARNLISVSTREFSHLKLRGEFIQIFPGDDCSALNEIHKNYIASLNHGICRDYWPGGMAWKLFTKDDPYAAGSFIYLWNDESGRPGSYLKYQDVKQGDDHIISVRELAFTGRASLHGALSLIGVLGAQSKTFQWLMPAFLDASDLLDEDYEMEQKIVHRDMTRVVNTKAALERMRRPPGEGAYVIEAHDPVIPANCRRFLVEYGPGESRVSPTRKGADLVCDMPVLSQLVTGYRSLESVLYTRRSGIEVTGNRETLDRVFTRRPQHLTEYF